MKSHSENGTVIVRRYRSLALAAALLLPNCVTTLCQAGPPAALTTNIWDCVLSGKGEQGIALLSFTEDANGFGNYFRIVMIHTPTFAAATTPSSPPPSGGSTNVDNGRGGGGDSGRNSGGTVITNAVIATNTNVTSTVITNIYGYFDSEWTGRGTWYYNNATKTIIGFFYELVRADSVSSTNFITNQVSFTAKVTNKRFTAVLSTSISGKTTLSGVPQTVVPNLLSGTDFSGLWQGTVHLGDLWINELFTLTPAVVGPFSNIYTVNGTGPGYVYNDLQLSATNYSIVSYQKKIGFSVQEYHGLDTNFVQRATVGPLKNTRTIVSVTSKGTRDPGKAPASFNAWWLSP